MAQRTGPQFDPQPTPVIGPQWDPQPGDVMTAPFGTYIVERTDDSFVYATCAARGTSTSWTRSRWADDFHGRDYARPVPAAAPPFPTAAVLRALADAARAYGDPGGGEGDPILYTLLDKVDTLVGVRSSWDAVANALVDAADALEVPRAV